MSAESSEVISVAKAGENYRYSSNAAESEAVVARRRMVEQLQKTEDLERENARLREKVESIRSTTIREMELLFEKLRQLRQRSVLAEATPEQSSADGVGDSSLEAEITIDEDTGLASVEPQQEADSGSIFAASLESYPQFTITVDPTVHVFPGHICCSKCTQPMKFQDRKTGELHAICWCFNTSCELFDARLVLDAQPLPVRRFEG